jgi:amino acid transporter
MRPFILSCALLFAGSAAQASSIAIFNAGFEDPVLADGDYVWGLYPGGTVVGGWTTAGGVGFGAGIINPTAAFFSAGAPEGQNVGFLISYNSAWLIQTLATTYEEGETYTLSALVGDADNRDLKEFSLGLYVSGSLKSTGGSSPVPADDGFTLVTATVVADASMDGKPIEIRMGSGGTLLVDDPDSTDFAVYFDDLHLTTTAVVPVPAGVWMLGSALGLLGGLRRRVRR